MDNKFLIGFLSGFLVVIILVLAGGAFYLHLERDKQSGIYNSKETNYKNKTDSSKAKDVKVADEAFNRTLDKANNLLKLQKELLLCGKRDKFKTEAWYADLLSKIANEYKMSDGLANAFYNAQNRNPGQRKQMEKRMKELGYKDPVKYIREQEGKFLEQDINNICYLPERRLVMSIASGGYCRLGAVFRYDIKSGQLERVFYNESTSCSHSLVEFEPHIVDGIILPVKAVFGDAGFYSEVLYYYDFVHDTLSFKRPIKKESAI